MAVREKKAAEGKGPPKPMLINSNDGADPFGYPRPMLRRKQWMPLNGAWQFALDEAGQLQSPADVTWDRSVEVPYAPESVNSGVHNTGFYRACWYRRTFEC